MLDEGATKREIREKLGDLIDGQEAPQTDVFIGQISAASEGLNLQRATISIYYSRDYSLKNHIQSLGRNHRGGQKNTVVYYNIVCCRQSGEDTVDMRVLAALTRKEGLSQRINKDDIKFLLPNFKKKDREAIKDIVVTDEEDCTIPDDTGIEPEAAEGKVEVKVEAEPPIKQPGLF
jgi:SNF2 family DNA or RNA helicase